MPKHKEGAVFEVMTFPEAEAYYGLGKRTLHTDARRGKFLPEEARKSAGTWIVTHEAIKRLYPVHYNRRERFNEKSPGN